ncbi:MAG: YfhO family protein, partial [Eubacteriales bacterium]|nr:YfhO family protein [Eubacteriales bacterium]
TNIKGSITSVSDSALMFSIPYDAGWTVYVDGKKTNTYTIKDALLAVNVSAGTHQIELRYIPKNLILGCIITFLSILLLAGISLFHRFRREGRIVTSRWPLLLQELIDEHDIVYTRPKHIIMTQTDIDNMNLDNINDFDILEDMDTTNTDTDNNTLGRN